MDHPRLGHPPGALLTFVWLDRIGLGGGAWAGLLCLLVGSSAAAAIVVAVRALADEETARLVAPFVAVAPTAIWVAVSADGYFAGVAAWGIALLALAARGTVRCRSWRPRAPGLLLGWAIFLNYGLGADGAARGRGADLRAVNWRSAMRALVPAVLAALAVVGAFAIAGFWWFDGYTLVQQRYWQGIAMNRPFQYWWWANSRVGGVRDRAGQRGGHRPGVRHRGDQAALRTAPVGAGRAARDPVRGPVHAEQGRDGTDLAAVHGLADRRRRLAAAAVTPLVAGLNVIGALLLNHFILTNW